MLYVNVDTFISLSNRIEIFNKQEENSKEVVVKVKIKIRIFNDPIMFM